MNPTVLAALVTLAAYLIGSLSFAVIVSRAMGMADPRSYGSKNPGATNVLRSGSKAAAVVTLSLDALKGYLPVLLVRLFGPAHGLGDGAVALVALAAFLGHLWPVFFRFEGGKGVATAGGAMLGIEPWLGLATIGVWIAVAALWRYSSLASLAAAVFAPLFRLLVWGGGPIAAAVAAISLLLVWRHAANISRLLAGTESKLGAKRAAGAAQRPH